MLGFRAIPLPLTPIFPSKFKPTSPFLPIQPPNFPSLSTIHIKSQPPNPNPNFQIYAKNGNRDSKNNVDGRKIENGRPRFNLRWVDLVLNSDPDNIVTVGLTGLLTWASVQILWQLLVISAAILLAALKYTIVAVLLIFILITLL